MNGKGEVIRADSTKYMWMDIGGGFFGHNVRIARNEFRKNKQNS